MGMKIILDIDLSAIAHLFLMVSSRPAGKDFTIDQKKIGVEHLRNGVT